jgi:hypothetical protein
MTTERSRFSKEIAVELIAHHGAFAHLHALEKLETYVSNDMQIIWRDVIAWLDELGEDDETILPHLAGREGEHGELSEAHSADDAETTRPVSLHDGADGVGQ